MDGMPLRILLRSFLPITLLALAACGQVNSAKTPVSGPSSSSGSGGSTTPPPPSSGGSGTVVNSAGFFVAITGNVHSAIVPYMHQADAAYGSDIGTTNFTSECKIADGSAAGGDILCVAEVEELDLYFNNLQIQYHVPSDMCTYLRVRPYWFYAFEPGTGPITVSHEVLADLSIHDVLNTANGIPTCQYDHSAEGGPNCCSGTYNHLKVTYASDGTFTQDTTPGTWGGTAGDCAAGPGTTTEGFTRYAANKLPLPKITYVSGLGLNTIMNVVSPVNSSFSAFSPLSSNVWTSNFYNPSDHTGGMPLPLQTPAAVTNPSSLHTPADTYEFQCLDGAYDIQQRIRLFVREWNTHDALAPGGDPDLTGAEPNFPTFPLNDRSDWLDFGDLYPASSI